MDIIKDEQGEYPKWAWPGGYTIYYLTEDGGVLCPDCANGENGSLASETSDDPQWKLVASDLHQEGPPLICDHCGFEMESDYGDPDAEETAREPGA